MISNSLEYSAFQLVPEIAHIKERLQDMGFDAVLMSGSGSTVFAITKNKELLQAAYQNMNDGHNFVCQTRIKKDTIHRLHPSIRQL